MGDAERCLKRDLCASFQAIKEQSGCNPTGERLIWNSHRPSRLAIFDIE